MNAGLKPRDIDFLVLNCSLFSPTPSLTAMVINHFKMRSDIISYNLGGESGSVLRCLLSGPHTWIGWKSFKSNQFWIFALDFGMGWIHLNFDLMSQSRKEMLCHA